MPWNYLMWIFSSNLNHTGQMFVILDMWYSNLSYDLCLKKCIVITTVKYGRNIRWTARYIIVVYRRYATNRIIKWHSLIIAWWIHWTRLSQSEFWLFSSEFWSSSDNFGSALEDCSLLPNDNWLMEEQLSLNREWSGMETGFGFKG